MSVSFHGIGQWCATFLGDGIQEGAVVKVTGQGTAAACAPGDPFCGVAVAGDKEACTVQLGGFARLSYDTAAPAIGYTALSADGKGGVQSDEDGRSYWVVEQDAAAKTVTVLL